MQDFEQKKNIKDSIKAGKKLPVWSSMMTGFICNVAQKVLHTSASNVFSLFLKEARIISFL